MSFAVLGNGNIGSTVAMFLRKWGHDVTTFDCDRTTHPDICTNLTNEKKLKDIVNAQWDALVNALPAKFGYNTLMAIAECGGNCVDVTFMSEDPSEEIPEEAENNGSIIMADFGLAPGITNMLVGLVDQPKNIKILVGGNPIHPKPPLFYNPRFEADTLIEEYVRPARIIRNGKSVILEPLSEPEMSFFEGVGVQEGFITDGLRSLLYYDSLENAVEKTLRWPGHRDRITLLKEMDMLSPEIFTGGTDDVVTLKAIIDGRTWTMTCFAEDGLSAMAKTTACPVACAAVRIKDSGLSPWVHAPEDLPNNMIMDIMDSLRQEGIEIKEE